MDSRIVYSTEYGQMCPECSQPIDRCLCRERLKIAVAKTDGIVSARYETKGRKGKGATVITGLALSQTGLEELSRILKQRFGCGGSVQGYTIELQGDHCDQVQRELRAKGYAVK